MATNTCTKKEKKKPLPTAAVTGAALGAKPGSFGTCDGGRTILSLDWKDERLEEFPQPHFEKQGRNYTNRFVFRFSPLSLLDLLKFLWLLRSVCHVTRKCESYPS